MTADSALSSLLPFFFLSHGRMIIFHFKGCCRFDFFHAAML